MNDLGKKRVAFVLSGGASQGAYQVGVLEALCDGKSPSTDFVETFPDVLTGTSAGSFNAAALLGEMEAKNPDPIGYLKDLWLNRLAKTGTSCGNGVFRVRADPRSFFDFGCLISDPLRPGMDLLRDFNFLVQESVRRGRQVLSSTNPLSQRALDQVNLSTFAAMDRFQTVLEEAIKFDLVSRSSCPIRVGAVRWDTGFIHYFSNRDMTVDLGPKIVQASSAVPRIFPRVTINGVEYGDGGTIENSPLQGAVEEGAEVIHVITSFPRTANIPSETTSNTLDTLYRALVINVSKSIRRDIQRYKNVNDGLLALESLRQEGNIGEGYEILRETIAGIIRQENPDYRRVEIHVHKPPEPLANLREFFKFDREYLHMLIRRGYYDTIGHNCKENGCVLLDRNPLKDLEPVQAATKYGLDDGSLSVNPGVTF